MSGACLTELDCGNTSCASGVDRRHLLIRRTRGIAEVAAFSRTLDLHDRNEVMLDVVQRLSADTTIPR